MIDIQTEGRRAFLLSAAAFAVLPLLPGCRPDVSAQIGGADVRQRLLKNAIADAGCSWCGARDMPEKLAAKAVIAGREEKGERVGDKTIIQMNDGTSVEVDAAWSDRQGIWYRRGGLVSFVESNRVKAIRAREEPKPAAVSSPTP